MQKPFENIVRSEWSVKNQKRFLDSIIELFQQLTSEDKSFISERIENDLLDYFEVPHYDQNTLCGILVFQRKRVFFDILDPSMADSFIEKIKTLAKSEATFIKSRQITHNEIKKRIEALTASINSPDPLVEGFQDDEYYNMSVPCDDTGVINRGGFYLIAKEPALEWILQCEKREPDYLPKIEWDLNKINDEPNIYLIPPEIELYSPQEQKQIWSELKRRSFYDFVEGYYTNEHFWPNFNQKTFDEWFEIKPVGLIIDIASDLA